MLNPNDILAGDYLELDIPDHRSLPTGKHIATVVKQMRFNPHMFIIAAGSHTTFITLAAVELTRDQALTEDYGFIGADIHPVRVTHVPNFTLRLKPKV